MNDRYDETRSVVATFGALHVRRCTRCGVYVEPDSTGLHDAQHDRIDAWIAYGEQLAALEAQLTDEQVEQAARLLAPLYVATGPTPDPVAT